MARVALIKRQTLRRYRSLLIAACLLTGGLQAQSEWSDYGNDKGAQRYSRLRQINTSNVAELKQAWTFSMRQQGLFRPSESIPLVIKDVLYLSFPFNCVVALRPENGQTIWEFSAPSNFSGKLGSMRSVAYWPGTKASRPEVLFATEEGELYALDAMTGKPVHHFGMNGVVNLKTPQIMNGYPDLHYGVSSAPFVFKDLVITGSHLVDETGGKGPAGDVRAWDARTGELKWTFHSVPRPGEVGNQSWSSDQWQQRTGVNVWSFFTADVHRGILYMPFGSANNDFYGVDRPGDDLFANSLVAVDAATGKLKWYYQLIHHDLWDYDLPVPPILFDVVHPDRTIPVVGVMSKMGMLFILNRVTGKPIYGVEERAVPAGVLPGEQYSPTQPFPLKPAPLSRLSFTSNDIAQITPDHEKDCREMLEAHGGPHNRGPFTPASAEGALVLPTTAGGASWTGGTYDAALYYYIINTSDTAGWRMIKRQDKDPVGSFQSPRLYAREGGGQSNAMVNGLPCWQPPWGRLTAIDVNTGDIAWQVPFGFTPKLPPNVANAGGFNSGGGPISTAGGLVFIGATRDRAFHAFDAKTGRELWHTELEDIAQSAPSPGLPKMASSMWQSQLVQNWSLSD